MDVTESVAKISVRIQTQISDREGCVAFDLPLFLNVDARQLHIPVSYCVRK